ncbi:hypothetical protein [Antrihabitans sp. YC2-6]|uniref:hypothetical protein n=1 Tax=Antrihabitans sp. YC2-6 TaxID=2799498 RepID=UPI0018F5A9EE|nr:hypothetical protein [Antrihabitans sp. YC2-6]MBJ8344505.1 hypothetical protein [Antrihabitans sp. YC2-6]
MDTMVTRLHRLVRTLLLGAVLAALALLLTAPITSAEPVPAPPRTPDAAPILPPVGAGDPGNTFGFNETCEKLGEKFDPGGSNLNPLNALPNLLSWSAENQCKMTNVVTHPGEALNAFWNSSFGKSTKAMIAGVADGYGTVLNWWFSIPTPKLADVDYLTVLQSYMMPIQLGVLCFAIMLAAVRIAWARAGSEGDVSLDLLKVIGRVTFVTTMFGVVVAGGTKLADVFSLWLLSESSGGDLGDKVEAMLLDDNSTWGPGWILLIAIFGMGGALLQAVFLVIRQAFLIVIVGFMPMAAAASGTEMGANSYTRMMQWTFAFIAFKPIAAGIMATAFWAADPGSDASKLQGLMLLTVSAVALPAVMRVLGVSSMVGGSGMGVAGAMMSGVGAAAAVVSGGAAAVGGKALAGVRASTARSSAAAAPSVGGYTGAAAKSGARQMPSAPHAKSSGSPGFSNGSSASQSSSSRTPTGLSSAAKSGKSTNAVATSRAGTAVLDRGSHGGVDDIPHRSLGANEVPL